MRKAAVAAPAAASSRCAGRAYFIIDYFFPPCTPLALSTRFRAHFSRRISLFTIFDSSARIQMQPFLSCRAPGAKKLVALDGVVCFKDRPRLCVREEWVSRLCEGYISERLKLRSFTPLCYDGILRTASYNESPSRANRAALNRAEPPPKSRRNQNTNVASP